MGRIKQGILGGFLGKVGGVVGSNWKGIATMRAMPLSVANPKTVAQVKNRTRFSQVTGLATAIGVDFMRVYWNRGAMQMSGFNSFCQVNKDVFNDVGVFLPGSVKMSQGIIEAPVLSTIEISSTLKAIHGNLAYGTGKGQLSTDIIEIVCVDADGAVAMVQGGYDGSVDEFGFDLPAELAVTGKVTNVYAVSRRADGSQFSNSNQYSVIATV